MTQDVRDYAATHGIAEETTRALASGLLPTALEPFAELPEREEGRCVDGLVLTEDAGHDDEPDDEAGTPRAVNVAVLIRQPSSAPGTGGVRPERLRRLAKRERWLPAEEAENGEYGSFRKLLVHILQQYARRLVRRILWDRDALLRDAQGAPGLPNRKDVKAGVIADARDAAR